MTLPNIDPDVWAARPLLKDVREAAHRRTAGADAVLWSVLVSVAAHVPARVAIDTGIGTPVRPTLYAVLAGASGTGKSVAWGVGRALVPDVPEPLPLSTGEGMAEAFYGRVPVEQPQPDGKPPKIVWARRRVRSNALLFLDEGETLFRQAERPGSVVGPTLRSFWSGGTVGQANATEDSRRSLDAGTYTAGLVVGLQPDISGRLLADTATGTAQRFVWVSTTDAYLPDDQGPAAVPASALAWSPPVLPGTPSVIEQWRDEPVAGMPWTMPAEPAERAPVSMTLDREIARGIRDEQTAIRRGEVEPDEHDTQRTAMHVKVAAVLAWMDGRLGIGAEDWQLAGALLRTSDQVRDALIEHAEMAAAAERAERGTERAQVSRAESRADGMRERCRTRLVELLSDLADQPSIAHAELRRGVTTAQRPFVPEVLAELLAAEAVTIEPAPSGGRRYTLGPGVSR